MSFFRWTGVILSALAFIIGGYETAGLLLPQVPTISRLLQGMRDAGMDKTVFAISIVFVCIFAVFGAWLYYHLNYQVRSGN